MAGLRLISEPSGADEAPLDAYSRVVTEVARELSPSVASLRFRRGAGSAVVVTPDGFLLTSAHVVRQARRGTAAFVDGRELEVEVVGADPLSDLAVLRADGRDLAEAGLGDAESLQVGQLVVAIGNPHGFAGSVTAGVVSALGRSLPTRSGSASRIVENVITSRDGALTGPVARGDTETIKTHLEALDGTALANVYQAFIAAAGRERA